MEKSLREILQEKKKQRETGAPVRISNGESTLTVVSPILLDKKITTPLWDYFSKVGFKEFGEKKSVVNLEEKLVIQFNYEKDNNEDYIVTILEVKPTYIYTKNNISFIREVK